MKCVFFLFLTLSINLGYSQDTLTLEDCIQLAITKSLEVKVGKLKSQIISEEEKSEKFDYLPNLSLSASQGFSLGSSFNVSTSVGQRESRFNNLSLSSSLKLFTGLERRNKIEALNIQKKQNEVLIRDVKKELKLIVIEKYAEVLLQREFMIFAQNQVLVSREKFNLSKQQKEKNLLSEQKLLENQALYLSDSSDYGNVVWQFQSALFELGNLIGKNNFMVDSNIRVSLLENDNQHNSNYQLLFLKKKIELSENQVKILKSNYYPKLYFQYSFGSNYYHLIGEKDLIFNQTTGQYEPNGFLRQINDNRTHYLNFSLSYNIFNRFETTQKVKIEQINQKILDSEIELKTQELAEYFDLLKRKKSKAYQDIQLNNEMFTLEKQIYSKSEKKYFSGLISYSEFIESKNRLYLSKQKLSMAQSEYFIYNKFIEVLNSND